MNFPAGISQKEKVEFLERYILVHSILYYSLNENIISDKKYDKRAQLLAKKVDQYGVKRIMKTQYGYVFHDFDGNTGFDLIDRLKKSDREYLTKISQHILKLYKGELHKCHKN